MSQEFQVIIEKDTDGIYVSEVVGLKGCHTQAKTIDELLVRTKEAIELYLEVETDLMLNDFVGIQKILV